MQSDMLKVSYWGDPGEGGYKALARKSTKVPSLLLAHWIIIPKLPAAPVPEPLVNDSHEKRQL